MTENIYEQMAEKIGMVGTKIIPELFKMIADQDEAALLMMMPGTPEQLVEKTGKPLEEIEKMCQTLYYKGLAFKSFKTGKLGYRMCAHFVQFHDATALWPDAPQAFLDLWQKCMEEELPEFNRKISQFIKKPYNRIIAVEESADSVKQQILEADSANKVMENAEVIAVTNCSCRTIAKKCDKPLEACIQVNNAARYAIDRGTGREISKKEAIEILKDCEEKGLVHVTVNKTHVGHYICNCCSCCCQTFPIQINEGLNICDPSRFQAQIDAELCTACGTCTERCFFSALEEVAQTNGEEVMGVVADKCMGCGLCTLTCPEDAITMVETKEPSFIPV